jgi:GT2 family glycosyltransferase
MEKVSIIIANYNGKHFLEVSIPSVLRSTYTDFELIVCDDASTDDSVEYLLNMQKLDTRILLIRNAENMGAAATRNHAVTKATGKFLILLDNDTEVNPDWIEPLILTLQNDNTIGAVQSTLVDYKERDKIQLSGTKLIPHVCWGIPLNKGELITEQSHIRQEIIAISAALAVRHDIYINVRGFDETLAVYTEDLEFSLRIWICGFRIVSCPESVVYHWTKRIEDRKTMNATKERIYFHLAKNTIRTILKNYSLSYILVYFPWALVILSVRMLIKVARGEFSALSGTMKAFILSVVILPQTLVERKQVQKLRKFRDPDIFERIATTESLTSIYKNYFA